MEDTQIEKKSEIYEDNKQEQSPPSILYSPSSSPSHEFSFTISFNPSPNINNNNNNPSGPLANDKSKLPPPLSSSAMDLSPADDIFFHGHLLPLQLLPHFPTSPRNSLDSFTLPIEDHTSNNNNDENNRNKCNGNDVPIRKAKSFSLFGRSRWRKESENGEKEREKKKPRFDVSHMLKRYMRMVRPLLSMKSSKRGNGELFHKQSHSYSGNVSLRHNDDYCFETTRRREFSAPASMWTSPSNSGILMAKGKNLPSPCSAASSDSTMEELQAAIQAAITHCKNSIATDEKNQMP